jgi:hypothetical protein
VPSSSCKKKKSNESVEPFNFRLFDLMIPGFKSRLYTCCDIAAEIYTDLISLHEEKCAPKSD